jgi:DNA invertase Pin-like site-specific DNA recombinase
MASTDNAATKRMALYARTSTTRDQSPAMQLEELRRVALQRGWQVVGEYVDHGDPAQRTAAPSWTASWLTFNAGVSISWPSGASTGSHDRCAIWCWALEDFRARCLDFVALHDAIDTSPPGGRFTFHVIAAVAELEREIIRERVRCGVQAAIRRGEKIGRPRKDVDVDAALAMRATGKSLREIARDLKVGLATLHRALHGVPETSPDPFIEGSDIVRAA